MKRKVLIKISSIKHILQLFWEFSCKILTLTNPLVMNEGVNFITEPFPEQLTSVFPVFRDLSKKETCKKREKKMRRTHSWLGWVAASGDKIPKISNQGPLTTHKFYSHNFPFLVFLPWNKHILKHRKNCESCQSQVTWKGKFKSQLALSCPVPSGYPNPTRYPVFLLIPDPIQF